MSTFGGGCFFSSRKLLLFLEELDEARQRVVHQVNKPPQGNRHPRGTTPPSLEEQLTQAAWPRTPRKQWRCSQSWNEQQPSSTVRDNPYTGRQAPVSIEDLSRGSYSYSEHRVNTKTASDLVWHTFGDFCRPGKFAYSYAFPPIQSRNQE
ncbi:uncharacterized protein LOC9637903 [Selaginella moellendorffii]|uniref:uncharacterized protein LOC9637903 n=1 Tax=Selaginella moellendorffii TaxID=88036 RepID=UPI000D1CC6D9|nr:uncharacterized protein LOC9637903 [Selaginella moellendorffii]|eukprot:XP_024534127.1 uncharacterized protein LOC9637903 [Selaginella moellendorffii]